MINNYNWVQTESIKNIISNFNYIKLIKIDIEGAETEILPHIIKNRNKENNLKSINVENILNFISKKKINNVIINNFKEFKFLSKIFL
jgi:hypothetical protein